MHLATLLFWFMFLVNTNRISAASEILSTTTASTETNTVNTIDVLQSQLNQILVQFCASEIDRNKTASAVLKFGQLADAKVSIKNVVHFYTENYEESFDNLLLFINHISSLELQQIAYNTLVEAINTNQINVINLLSFENFIRTKFILIDEDNMERRIYQDLLLTIGNHIKERIIATDLNRLITFINNSPNPDRIFELIPIIVQGIDLNNFTDMNRIFEFSVQLPKGNQLKLISKVLSEMQAKTQYRHVFHVIFQIRMLRKSINNGDWNNEEWMTNDICSLYEIERKFPSEITHLLEEDSRSQIKHESDIFLSFSDSSKYSKTLLFLTNDTPRNGMNFKSQTHNSVSINYNNYDYYLSVEYCFHNESFPTLRRRDSSDLTQINWYILMADDLSYIQIKNIYTNEFLISEDYGGDTRVALSANCSDCISSRWLLQIDDASPLTIHSLYSCPRNDYAEASD